MSRLGGFAYVQARIQARYAQLLSDREWQRLAAVRAYSAYLQEVRATALRPWVAGISEVSDSHEIERNLRQQFRVTVGEVQAWAPECWQPAVGWLLWLPDLPLLDHVLAGGSAPSGAERDPSVRAWLDGSGRLQPAALQAVGGGDLLITVPSGRGLGEVWLHAWRRRWGSCKRVCLGNLEQLAEQFQTYRAHLTPASTEAARDERQALRDRMRHLFHRSVLQPAGLFSYLALVAIDLERLRGALVTRALFDSGETGP